MRICLLSESTAHSVLDDALDRLAHRHSVTVCNPAAPGAAESLRGDDAELYLLKSRVTAALRIARAAERAGAVVVNRTAPTARCRDRLATAVRFADAKIPAPRTWGFGSLAGLAGAGHPDLRWPLVVKSRHSRRGDLVRLVARPDGLPELLPDWQAEPVVVQEYLDNDGWDVKIWVIGDSVAAARRPTALRGRDTSRDVRVQTADLPAEWVGTAVRAGRLLGLELFGVDLVISDGRPLVVDVNAFPGFRSADSAAASIAAYVDHLAARRRACA